MTHLRLDELWHLLPRLDELRPLQELLLSRSVPDPRHAWSASGELDTVGTRLVAGDLSPAEAAELARQASERAARLFALLSRALSGLADGDRTGAAVALLEIAALEEGSGDAERAEAWARSAFLVARDEKDQRPAALALRRWGRAARARGDLSTALERYRDGYEISYALGDARAGAEAAVGAGNVLEDQGRWTDAERWYRRALALLDENASEGAAERWHALLNLHIVLRSQGRLEASLPLLDAAADAAVDDAGALPFFENARGQLRQVQGDHVAAEGHFRRALDAASSPAARVVVGVNLAECLLAQGRRLDAAEAARRAEVEAVSNGVVPRLPEVYRLLGRVASEGGNPDAFVLFERALELIDERGLPAVEKARTLQAYAEAEGRRGDAATARELHVRAEALYRSLGIASPRHRWSEYFAPTDPNDDEPHEAASPPSADDSRHD